MRIAVVDDESEAIRTLEDYIGACAVELGMSITVDGFSDSASFREAFAPGSYQIVFLDIYIDETDGLELARGIRAASENTMIIFCTTSQENMPEAFHFHAFDYLVKPITKERIQTLLVDAKKVLPSINRFFTFVANRQEVHLPFSECLWTQSQGHYLHIKSRSGEEYTSRMTTKDLLGQADGDKRFLTINKGIVVNMDQIRRFEKGNCAMTDGTTFPIKVRQAGKIEQLWQDYIFSQLREGQK